MLFNPLKDSITRTVAIPLYYTGLSGSAMIRAQEGTTKKIKLNGKDELVLNFTIAPENDTWFVIE